MRKNITISEKNNKRMDLIKSYEGEKTFNDVLDILIDCYINKPRPKIDKLDKANYKELRFKELINSNF